MRNRLLTLICGLAAFLSAMVPIYAQTRALENNLICNDPISGTGTIINAARTGGATDAGRVIDGDLNNFATLNLTLGVLGGGVGISVSDTSRYYPGGNRVGFIVEPVTGLLNATAFANFQIRTYRNGALVQTATFGGSGIQASALGGALSGRRLLSFVTAPGSDFDEVQLFYSGGAVGALTSVRVYNAFEGPASCPIECVNALTTDFGATAAAGPSGGVCVACAVNAPGNVADADTTNAATIITTAGLGVARSIDVNFTSAVPANSEVGFLVSSGGLIDATVLGGITVSTLDVNGDEIQSFSGTGLLSADVLGNSRYRIGFRPTSATAIRGLRITVGGVVAIAINLNVFYAYFQTDTDNDGYPDCIDRCAASPDNLDGDGDGVPDGCDTNIASLAITKVGSAETATVGSTVSFTVTVTREDPALNANGVIVTDSIPAGLTLQSFTTTPGTVASTATIGATGGTLITWTIGSFLGGATNTASLVVTARVDSVGVNANFVRISDLDETDPNPGNNATSDCVSVPIAICEGDTVTLSVPTGLTAGIQWFNNGVAIAGANGPTFDATVTGSYTYTAVGSSGCASGNCCPVIVNVTPAPEPDITASSLTICAGTSTSLTVGGVPAGGTILWSTGETGASISVSPTVTTVYSVTVTSAGGCSGVDSVTVTVNPTPVQAPIVAVCGPLNSGTFAFTINPSTTGGGTSYSVSINGGAAQTFPYGTPQTFTGLTTSPTTVVITDVTSGCSITRTVTAPASCPTCSPTPVCVPITVTRRIQ